MSEHQSEHAGKRHKPARNHPWRNPVPSKVKTWAKEQTPEPLINNYVKGGGKKQK